ncbi:MAG: hypothetical protein Kapaf2KO_19160 [Candidatus Kapaibacteriales bacterium]
MKLKYLALLPALAFASCSNAVEHKIPAEIVTAFNKAYPNAENVEWEIESEGYEVEFTLGEDEMEVTYGKDGTVLEIEKNDEEIFEEKSS